MPELPHIVRGISHQSVPYAPVSPGLRRVICTIIYYQIAFIIGSVSSRVSAFSNGKEKGGKESERGRFHFPGVSLVCKFIHKGYIEVSNKPIYMKFVPVVKTLTTEVCQKILPALGINASQPNKGVYDGSWYGSGEVVTSVDPSTNQPIASVQTVLFLIVM